MAGDTGPRVCRAFLRRTRWQAVLFLLVVICSHRAEAMLPAGWWTPLGPSDELTGRSLGGTLVGGRGDSPTFYLATEAGLWRGGEQGWQRHSGGPALAPETLLASPLDPSWWVVVTNLRMPVLGLRADLPIPVLTGFVEVSRDGGSTFERCWQEAPLRGGSGAWQGENLAIAAVDFDAVTPLLLYVATGDGLVALDLTRCGEAELRNPLPLHDVLSVRASQGTVLLGASRESVSRLLRSVDGGQSWLARQSNAPGSARRWVLAASRSGTESWALSGSSPSDEPDNLDLRLELWRSGSDGASWRRRSELPLRGAPRDLLVDFSGRLLVVVDTPEGGRVVRSDDGGLGWEVTSPIPTALPIRLALAGSELGWSSGGNIWLSSDGGDIWRELLPRPRAPVAGRLLASGEELLMLDPVPAVSNDGGTTWTATTVSLPDGVVVAELVGLRRSAGSGVTYATVARSEGPRVVASEDGGRTWTTALAGPPGFGRVAVVEGGPARTDDVVLWLRPCPLSCNPESPGELWRSDDGGLTWVEVSRPFVPFADGFDVRRIGGQLVMAAAGSGPAIIVPSRADHLSFSIGGESFENVPLPPLVGELHWVHVLDLEGDDVSLLLGAAAGVYRTGDSGATWQRVELHPATFESLPPAADPDDDDRLWLATDRAGVFESVDAGRTWHPLPGLAGGLAANDLVFDGSFRTLWAATSAGLFARARPPLGECEVSEIAHCLAGGRFRAEARFVAGEDGQDAGIATTSEITGDTGAFWFFDSQNVELLVKVLEGCAVNDSWWVFATGLTDVEVELVVTDTATGVERRYVTPGGSPFAPRFDTAAFPCG
jgi:hypothetical protein